MKPTINEILIEFSDIIYELKRLFHEGATEMEYHNLCERMKTSMNDEDNIHEDEIDSYLQSKGGILEMHEYPLDYSFDFSGHGPSYIRFCIKFK